MSFVPPARDSNRGVNAFARTTGRAFGLRSDFRLWHLNVWLLLCGLVPFVSRGQFTPPETYATRSFSGQFLVQVVPGAEFSLVSVSLETNRNFIRLDPTLVPVSCERIKQIISRDLGTTDPWRGKIFLTLYPARRAEDSISINEEQFSDGWQYRVLLPNVIERVRYVRTITQIVLLEMANRNATAHTAEVPAWLVEGMAQRLLASREMEIILPPPSRTINSIRVTYTPMDGRRENPLERAHQVLCAAEPLSFQQLSWFGSEPLTNADVYSSSSQLFVHQLLALPDGPAGLRTMLAQLPRYYNWQLAFLHAFPARFPRPLDVEKWWALQVTHFTGRDLTQTWTADDSWQKLQDIIHPVVQVRTGTNELPLQAQVSLQTIIREWAVARQPAALQNKLRELDALRLRLSQDLISLVDDYRQVLTVYLQTRPHSGLGFFHKLVPPADTAVRQLDALDSRLAALKPPVKPSSPIRADARQASTP